MGSYNYGKIDVLNVIMDQAAQKGPEQLRILDVGTCDGKWSEILNLGFAVRDLPEPIIDGCEAFKPNAAFCLNKYRNMFVGPICDYHYSPGDYDLVLFGDVIEHMDVKTARTVLEYAIARVEEVIVGVPYLYEQDAIYGNPFEVHIQPDLTEQIFEERYGDLGLVRFLHPADDYAYYKKAR